MICVQGGEGDPPICTREEEGSLMICLQGGGGGTPVLWLGRRRWPSCSVSKEEEGGTNYPCPRGVGGHSCSVSREEEGALIICA